MDLHQDYTLLDGAEIEGFTILKFKRKLVTCDNVNDVDIKASDFYILFYSCLYFFFFINFRLEHNT